MSIHRCALGRTSASFLTLASLTILAPAVATAWDAPAARLEPDGRGGLAFSSGEITAEVSATEVRVAAAARGGDAVILRLSGARPGARLVEGAPLGGTSSYFVGQQPSGWRSCVPHLASARFESVWDGVDVAWRLDGESLAFDFIVLPGGRIQDIAIESVSRVPSRLEDGALRIPAGDGELRIAPPHTYQDGPGGRVEVPSRFVELAPGRHGVSVGDHDRSLALVIDPVLSHSTYTGTLPGGSVWAAAPAASGGTWILRWYQDHDVPHYEPLAPHGSQPKWLLARLAADGSGVEAAAWLGPLAPDISAVSSSGTALAEDADGNVVVMLPAEPGFPVVGGFQSAPEGCASPGEPGTCSATYLAKLTPDLSAILWSTYFGGRALTNDMAIGPDGSVVLAGNASEIPVVGALFPERSVPGGDDEEGFIARIAPDGSSLIFSTYLGGSKDDDVTSVALDAGGNVIVAGTTRSLDFPWASTTRTSSIVDAPCVPMFDLAPCSEAFVARLTSNGSTLVHCTPLGGAGADRAWAVAADPLGNAVVAGEGAPDFPILGGFDAEALGASTAFVARLSPSGDLEASTFFGQPPTREAPGHSTVPLAVALDAHGRVHVAGRAGTPGFPIVDAPADIAPPTPHPAAFVTGLEADLSGIHYSAHVGSSSTRQPCDQANAVVVQPGGAIVIAGYTTGMDFPTTPGAMVDTPTSSGLSPRWGWVSRFTSTVPHVREPSALDQASVPPLVVRRAQEQRLILGWEETFGDKTGLYSGTIGSLRRSHAYDHASIECDLIDATAEIPMPVGDVYFLAVDRTGAVESSYGRDSFGRERPPARVPCR